MVIARSSASEMMRPAFTPGAGTTSNWVTTGPVVRPAMVPSTLNVRRVSSSSWPKRSSWASPASTSRRGGSSSSVIGGSPASSSARSRGFLRSGSFWLPLPLSSDSLDAAAAGSGAGATAGSAAASSAAAARRRLGRSGLASASGRHGSSGASSRRSSRWKGCQPKVKMVSADSARAPTRNAPMEPTRLRMAIARNPGTTPVARAARVRSATAGSRSTRSTPLSTATKKGASSARPPMRMAACFMSSRGIRSKPARPRPRPRSGSPTAPAPSKCQRPWPRVRPTGPVSGMGSRARPAKMPARSAAMAPMRRRSLI